MSAITLYAKKYLDTYSLDRDTMTNIEGISKAQQFCSYLQENNIDYKICIKHPLTGGCNESETYYKRFNDYLDFDYSICKHILVQERKGDKRVYLIIVDKDKKVDLNALKDILEARKLEFVSEYDMKELLDTNPGNVSIFNLVSDSENKVNLIMDLNLLNYDYLAFHPLYNGMTLFLRPKDAFKFLSIIKRDNQLIDIPEKKEKVKTYV